MSWLQVEIAKATYLASYFASVDLVDLFHLVVLAVLVHLVEPVVLDRHAGPLVIVDPVDPVGLDHLADQAVLDRHPHRPFQVDRVVRVVQVALAQPDSLDQTCLFVALAV